MWGFHRRLRWLVRRRGTIPRPSCSAVLDTGHCCGAVEAPVVWPTPTGRLIGRFVSTVVSEWTGMLCPSTSTGGLDFDQQKCECHRTPSAWETLPCNPRAGCRDIGFKSRDRAFAAVFHFPIPRDRFSHWMSKPSFHWRPSINTERFCHLSLQLMSRPGAGCSVGYNCGQPDFKSGICDAGGCSADAFAATSFKLPGAIPLMSLPLRFRPRADATRFY